MVTELGSSPHCPCHLGQVTEPVFLPVDVESTPTLSSSRGQVGKKGTGADKAENLPSVLAPEGGPHSSWGVAQSFPLRAGRHFMALAIQYFLDE